MSANLAASYIDAKEFGIIKSIIDSSILKIIRTVPEWVYLLIIRKRIPKHKF